MLLPLAAAAAAAAVTVVVVVVVVVVVLHCKSLRNVEQQLQNYQHGENTTLKFSGRSIHSKTGGGRVADAVDAASGGDGKATETRLVSPLSKETSHAYDRIVEDIENKIRVSHTVHLQGSDVKLRMTELDLAVLHGIIASLARPFGKTFTAGKAMRGIAKVAKNRAAKSSEKDARNRNSSQNSKSVGENEGDGYGGLLHSSLSTNSMATLESKTTSSSSSKGTSIPSNADHSTLFLATMESFITEAFRGRDASTRSLESARCEALL